jgi:heme a synthase
MRTPILPAADFVKGFAVARLARFDRRFVSAMVSNPASVRTPVYQPALAWFAAVGGFWVFVLVLLGAFTTTIGAGMVFSDWPLSNGSINPEGWLTDVAMFAEHSHRLSGTVMGLITIALAVWLGRKEPRPWVRKLGYWALAIVILQGLIGGKRVLLDAIAVPGFDMTLGQMLRIPHGILAQVYVCLLIAIAVAVSRPWIEGTSRPLSTAARRLAVACVGLLLVQLTVAVVMRHNFAGLAIPTFPWSTREGDLLPAIWSFPVAIHFSHRVMAVVLSVGLIWLAVRIWREAGVGLKSAAAAIVVLLAVQIMLGALTIWSMRGVYVTTAHVIGGAVLLAVTFGVACWTYRPADTAASSAAPAAAGPGRSRASAPAPSPGAVPRLQTHRR